MNSICIVTDSAAQFPNPTFPGRDSIFFLDLPIEIAGELPVGTLGKKGSSPPLSLQDQTPPRILPPSQENISQLLTSLNSKFNEILIMTVSGYLNPTFHEIEKVVDTFSGSARIYLIDTQTISIGQGFLVEQAAKAVHSGVLAADLEREIRKSIPHIFNILCTPSLNYLFHAGIIDRPQAVVSEYYNLYPLFILEDGKFTPLNKVRNYHSAIESFQEFLEEFENLKHISFLHGSLVPPGEIRLLKQFCDYTFPGTPFSEHQLNPYLTTMFGPGFMGLFISE
jgi:DegV family protein with EDD domain